MHSSSLVPRLATLSELIAACGLLCASLPAAAAEIGIIRSQPQPQPQGTATPKIAAVYFTPMTTAAEQARAAKFKLTLVGFYAGMGKARIQNSVNAIRAINPSIKLGTYMVLNEYRAHALPTDADYAMVAALEHNGWWARDAYTGARVQWTSHYGTWATNPTAATQTDANGHRWPQYKAQFDTQHILGGIRGLDYIYIDQVNIGPWVAADYLLLGVNQSIYNRELGTAYRKGMADYFDTLRALNPGAKLIVNAGTLDTPEFLNQVEGAFMECQMGRTWSIETWTGWKAMMDRYRLEMAQTRAPHDVVFQACNPTADPAYMRYGLASSLLEDGYFAFTVDGQVAPPWFDEYDAPLGTAAEAPPKAPTASGIWMRRYTNGIVLINPSTTTAASIDIGAGYKHLSGTQDPVVNNGLPERVITLQPRGGVIMLKQ